MCTVLFIPHKTGCCIASLRDEDPLRAKAVQPLLQKEGPLSYLAPVDGQSGGTWIGVNASGNIVVLLNGGFENHKKQICYRKSRGLIVSELLGSELPVVDWAMLDLEGMEPFTLVVWSSGNLYQLVWDGMLKHRLVLESGLPYLWSSSTLYDASAKQERERRFQHWIDARPFISGSSVLDFFRSFPDADNGFIMDRSERMKTISYSFIEMSNETNKAFFSYHDLETSVSYNQSLELMPTHCACD